jgi:hypothetical protein
MKLLTVILLAGVLGAAAHPAPADAVIIGDGCLSDSIGSCNSDFSGGAPELVAIRGWCYMIRWGWCWWWD